MGYNPSPSPRLPNRHHCLCGNVPRDQGQRSHLSPTGLSTRSPAKAANPGSCLHREGAARGRPAQTGGPLASPGAHGTPRLWDRTATSHTLSSLEILTPLGEGLCVSERSPPPLLGPQTESLILAGPLSQASGRHGRTAKWTVGSAWGCCFHEDPEK